MLKKLVYPSYFDVTPCTIVMVVQGRNGEEEIDKWEGKCNFSESTKRVQNSDGLWVHLSGVVHICGDIFPTYPKIEGYVIINNQKMVINGATRPRNPDGTVNHTRLELL